MKISVYANQCKREKIQDLLKQHTDQLVFYEDYDTFISEIPTAGSQVLIVARDGAEGMESVRAAKILLPRTPVIWFSDDNGFGPESYRVGCNYFSAQPLSEEILEKAMKRCER